MKQHENVCDQRRARADFILFLFQPNQCSAAQQRTSCAGELRCSQQVEVSVVNFSLTKYMGEIKMCVWL